MPRVPSMKSRAEFEAASANCSKTPANVPSPGSVKDPSSLQNGMGTRCRDKTDIVSQIPSMQIFK